MKNPFSKKHQNSRKVCTILFLVALLLSFVGIVCACQQPEKEVKTFYMLHYGVTNGGHIADITTTGDKILVPLTSQKVEQGKDAAEVVAIADDGYYFVKWSDGVVTAARKDTNVQRSFRITAEFAPISDGVTITYKSNILTYGTVAYETIQTVQRGTDGRQVQAVANSGGVFLKWSDGNTNPVRQEKNVLEDIDITAIFGLSVTYSTGEHGNIVGDTDQVVEYCGYASSVTAVPQKGYTFIGWSDGVKTATRWDSFVSEPLDVTANFEWRDTDNFTYNYNFATENYSEDYLTLSRGQTQSVNAVVPARDYFTFGGWYLDEAFQYPAFDNNGKPLLGEEVFDSPSRDLYAKWTVKEGYGATYKILMVYVSAVDGAFIGRDGNIIDVHYRMGELERKLYNDITNMFCQRLNDMLDGLVRFEVDSYFTTQIIDDECFNNQACSIFIWAHDIPELAQSGILDNYRSIITTFSFGGTQQLRPTFAGIGSPKYACVPLDECLINDETIEDLTKQFYNPAKMFADVVLSTYTHEFVHTIEQDITCYEFHESYNVNISEYTTHKLYLLNQWAYRAKYIKDKDKLKEWWLTSEKVGIPYAFWTNEIFSVVAKPECINPRTDKDYGGSVRKWKPYDDISEFDWWNPAANDEPWTQKVPKDSRTTWLTAEAKPGYKFIGWSDGCMDEARLITNVQQDITLIAYFERLSYSIEYVATEGGHIEGLTHQTALTGDNYQNVRAVADEGYRFVGWSDGRGNIVHFADAGGGTYLNEEGKLVIRGDVTVIAIFEKVEDEN